MIFNSVKLRRSESSDCACSKTGPDQATSLGGFEAALRRPLLTDKSENLVWRARPKAYRFQLRQSPTSHGNLEHLGVT